LEGYKEKSVENLLSAIEKSRSTTLDRLLVALGIPHVGKKTAKILSHHIFSSKTEHESVFHVLQNLDYTTLE
jgi:DNA ligase (NAD+)